MGEKEKRAEGRERERGGGVGKGGRWRGGEKGGIVEEGVEGE